MANIHAAKLKPYEHKGVPVTCPSCPYFALVDEDSKTGQCRCRPPMNMLLPQSESGMDQNRKIITRVQPVIRGTFPIVDENTWCGEHPMFVDAVEAALVNQEGNDAEPK